MGRRVYRRGPNRSATATRRGPGKKGEAPSPGPTYMGPGLRPWKVSATTTPQARRWFVRALRGPGQQHVPRGGHVQRVDDVLPAGAHLRPLERRPLGGLRPDLLAAARLVQDELAAAGDARDVHRDVGHAEPLRQADLALAVLLGVPGPRAVGGDAAARHGRRLALGHGAGGRLVALARAAAARGCGGQSTEGQ